MAKNKRKTITVTGIKKEEVKPGQALFLITSDRNDFVVRLASSVLTVTNTTENETLLNTFYRKDEEADMPTFENLCAQMERHNIFFDMKYFGQASVNFVTVEQPQATPRVIMRKDLERLIDLAKKIDEAFDERDNIERLIAETAEREMETGEVALDVHNVYSGDTIEPMTIVISRMTALKSALEINIRAVEDSLLPKFTAFGLGYVTDHWE